MRTIVPVKYYELVETAIRIESGPTLNHSDFHYDVSTRIGIFISEAHSFLKPGVIYID